MSSDEIRQFIRTLEFTPGAADMLRALKEDMEADVIIISDSNTIFIDELLDASGLSKHVDKVPTPFLDTFLVTTPLSKPGS